MRGLLKDFFSGSQLARFAGPSVVLTVLLYAGYSFLSPPPEIDDSAFEQAQQTQLRNRRLEKFSFNKKSKRRWEMMSFSTTGGDEEREETSKTFEESKIKIAQSEKQKRQPFVRGGLRGRPDPNSNVRELSLSGTGDVGVGVVDTGAPAESIKSSDTSGSDETGTGEDTSTDDSTSSDDDGGGEETSTSTDDSSTITSETTGTSGAGAGPLTSTTTTTTTSDAGSGSDESTSTTTTGGSPPPPPAGGDTTAPVVVVDLGSGYYNDNPTVRLTSNEFGPIYYCIKTGGTCCDPRVSGTLYSGAFQILDIGPAPENGNFCLQFYSQDMAGNNSALVSESYLVDNTNVPDMAVTIPKVQLQTNELQGDSKTITSPNFAAAPGTYQLSELKISGATFQVSCQDILAANAIPANLLEASATYDMNTLPGPSHAWQYTTANMPYGVNQTWSLIEEIGAPSTYGCVKTQILVQDFQVMRPGGGGNLITNGSGIHEFSGGFKPTGFFRAPADEADMGKYEGNGEHQAVNEVILESGFWNWVN